MYEGFSVERFLKLNEQFQISIRKNLFELSKGQKMSLAFMLAIARNADYLIMDEPLSGLDARRQKQLLDVLVNEVETREMGVLLSSHNLAGLEKLCDEITMLQEGKVILQKTTGDRLFLALLLVAFVIGFTLFHTTMSHMAQNGARQMTEALRQWQGALYNEIDVSDDYRQIVIDWFDEMEKADELEQFVNGFLFSFGGDEVVALCVWAGILLNVCFLLKWILENSGRRGEFVTLFPVQSKNVWLAEFLEGFVFIITAGTLLVGDMSFHQMKMTRAYKEGVEALARLKDTAYLDGIVIHGLLIVLSVLFIYSIFFFTKELVNVPSALFVIFPVTCFIPLIIGQMCYALVPGTEGSDEFFDVLCNLWDWELVYTPYYIEQEFTGQLLIQIADFLIPTVIFIIASRILHTKKDISSTKLFRFKWAEVLYLVITFCISFLCISYGWEKSGILKNIIAFIVAGVMTFAVWLLVERKATTLFQSKKSL